MQCDYTVQVARGSTVSLLLTDISMEQSTECIYDYISVCQIQDVRYSNICRALNVRYF